MNDGAKHNDSSSVRSMLRGCLLSLLVGIVLAAVALLLFEWAVDAASRPR